jgi:hypothetical protein
MVERRLAEVNLESIVPSDGVFPSPLAWEDQVFYFLMLDRFSDGNEKGYKDNAGNLVQSGTTPLYSPTDADRRIVSKVYFEEVDLIAK